MPDGGRGRNSVETRVRMLEEYVERHSHQYDTGTKRLDVLWDWYNGVVPQLKSMTWLMRLLVAALVANLGIGVFALIHH